jgi:hypothetical protein
MFENSNCLQQGTPISKQNIEFQNMVEQWHYWHQLCFSNQLAFEGPVQGQENGKNRHCEQLVLGLKLIFFLAETHFKGCIISGHNICAENNSFRRPRSRSGASEELSTKKTEKLWTQWQSVQATCFSKTEKGQNGSPLQKI